MNVLLLGMFFVLSMSVALGQAAPETRDQKEPLPLPSFLFAVDIGGQTGVRFQEVSGLQAEVQEISYRGGQKKGSFWSLKMPGIGKVSNVTLKRGIVDKGSKFLAWASQFQENTIKRETLTVRLLDERGQPVMTWTLTKARPTKSSFGELDPESDEVVIGGLEVVYEQVAISQPKP